MFRRSSPSRGIISTRPRRWGSTVPGRPLSDHMYRTAPLAGLWTHQKGGFYHDGRFADAVSGDRPLRSELQARAGRRGKARADRILEVPIVFPRQQCSSHQDHAVIRLAGKTGTGATPLSRRSSTPVAQQAERQNGEFRSKSMGRVGNARILIQSPSSATCRGLQAGFRQT